MEGYAKSENLNLLDTFQKMVWCDCAEIVGWTHVHSHACASSIRQSIKRYGKSATIDCIVRQGRVFLLKK